MGIGVLVFVWIERSGIVVVVGVRICGVDILCWCVFCY